MKIFEKMREGNKRIVYLFGIRVFSYIKSERGFAKVKQQVVDLQLGKNQLEEMLQLKEQLEEIRLFRDGVYNLFAPYNIFPSNETFTFEKWVPQSINFAKDIAGEIFKQVTQYIDSSSTEINKISFADVGGGVGAGSAYIRIFIQRKLYDKYKREIHVSMSVYDLQYNFKNFCERFFPDCQFFCSDFNLVKETFDFVISSHCIEYVEGPQQFVSELSAKANCGVFVYAPYNETLTDELRKIGHISSIDEDFIIKTKPLYYNLIKSDGYSIDCTLLYYKVNK